MRLKPLWVLVLGLMGTVGMAQVPTAEQLEMLRSMSPAEREAILSQFGIDPSALGGLTSGAGVGATGLPGASGSGAGAAMGLSGAGKNAADRKREAERLAKVFLLQPLDTVLLTISPRQSTNPADIGRNAYGLGSGGAAAAPPAAPAALVALDPNARGFMEAVRRGNPYTLDGVGQLSLPGVPPIALAGLTEQQAFQRLALEPSLLGFTINLIRLPVQRPDAAGLKPFGYDIFEDAASSFVPQLDAPVSSDYVMGSGDQVTVQLYGGQNRTLRLVVNREGNLSFPELGPISVTGKSFDDVRAEIESRVAKQMIGTQASVSIANARGIQVFVLGEAKNPGSYTVSGLSTVTSALYAAGGVALSGSLRDIQLKRQGSIVRRLDLYDLLLRGDTSNDAKILPGDVIFIPPVGAVASVEGEVRRPAIYELKGNVTVGSLVTLAGGFTADADADRLTVVRVGDDRRRVALDVKMSDAPTGAMGVKNGDRVSVARIRPTLDAGVVLEGHMFRPGTVAWREGLRLSDVIRSVDELKPGADLGYVLIRRELPPDRRVVVLSADLAAALREPGSPADALLSARDRITVFDIESGREFVLKPLLDELRRQSTIDQPTEVVSISGRIKAPGDYPLEPGMRISDLLRAGGRLADAAYSPKAELTRFVNTGQRRESELLEIDLAALLRGDAAADIRLQAFDSLIIKEVPEWSVQEYVTLRGEVRFPGRYPIRRGETLRSVIERAGGFSNIAFSKGAVFTRRELREKEAEQIAQLTERLQADLAALAISAGQVAEGRAAAQGALAAQGILDQLKNTRAVGRLVLDLDRVVAGRVGAASDVVLRDGDELVVPKIRQEVTVVGEVQNRTSHLYRPGVSRNEYIASSGGYTQRADKALTYVVRADGSVVSSGSGWFMGGNSVSIQPGDTIVVPLDTERLPTLPLWQAVTSIIYNSAVALAAVRGL
ncbi:MAG: SLBB domain-containing protein [Steroidobacteraceae bacterium]